MSIVIVGGHDRMVGQYKKICKSYKCKCKVFTQMEADFGKKIGLSDKQIDKLISPFLVEQPKVLELINNSFLEEKQKRIYLSSYKERLSRLQRKSISE